MADWTVATRDAWGGVAAWRYQDTPYLVARGGDCDRYWVAWREDTEEFLADDARPGYTTFPTREYAGYAIEAALAEETCERCASALPDDRTYCEDCEAVVILEQLEPGEVAR